MELAGRGGIVVRLWPIGYQFPDPRGLDRTDRSWLVIGGDVRTPDGAWTFEDPCLLVHEAWELGRWLHAAADGTVEPSGPDTNGDVWPDFDPIEPNLGVGLDVPEGGDVILRVHLSLESAPPWESEEQRCSSRQVFWRCWLTEDALHAAADQWLAEVARFPAR